MCSNYGFSSVLYWGWGWGWDCSDDLLNMLYYLFHHSSPGQARPMVGSTKGNVISITTIISAFVHFVWISPYRKNEWVDPKTQNPTTLLTFNAHSRVSLFPKIRTQVCIKIELSCGGMQGACSNRSKNKPSQPWSTWSSSTGHNPPEPTSPSHWSSENKYTLCLHGNTVIAIDNGTNHLKSLPSVCRSDDDNNNCG